MFCKKCGNEVKEESSFCDKCGAPISVGTLDPENNVQVSTKNDGLLIFSIISLLGGLIGFFLGIQKYQTAYQYGAKYTTASNYQTATAIMIISGIFILVGIIGAVKSRK